MWIIPTLSRPKNVAELLRQASALDKSEGIIFVNGADHATEYGQIWLPDGWKMHQHDRNIGAIGALNWLLSTYPNEHSYGFIGDDEFVYSPGWNEQLTKAAGDWNISHANDGWQSIKRIHSYVCIGGKLARAVGYLAIPSCWHWFGFDAMWEAIAQHIPIRRFVEQVETEHRHFMAHKVTKDKCYALGESRIAEDEKAFSAWMSSELPALVTRIKGAMAA